MPIRRRGPARDRRPEPGIGRTLALLLLAILWVAGGAAAAEPEEPPPEAGESAAASGASPPDAASEDLEQPTAEPGAETPAQDEALVGSKTAGIEEIVITGVQLEDTLQSEPVSATTFGSDEIKSLRIEDIQDLAAYTANLEINTKSGASNPTIFIRGIGLKDYNANAAGAVAVYQDGININAPAIQLFQLFDTASVQVLRGPQGSINGRNATAGAILVTSNQPGDEFDFNGSFTYGNYNNIQAEGAVSVPLIPNWLSSRVAFTANFRDGITKNNCAKWNPEKYPEFQPTPSTTNRLGTSYVVSPETLLEEYNKDVQAFETLGLPLNAWPEKYGISQTGTNSRRNTLRAAGLQGNALVTDAVCILQGPGYIITPYGESLNPTGPPAGTFVDQTQTPNLGDFQGLSHYVNDVNDWALRSILKLTPPQEDQLGRIAGVEWLLNLHGGQNRSGSAHLQMLGASAKPSAPGPGENGFFAALAEGWSEANAAQTTNFGLEGVRHVSGIDDSGSLLALEGSNPYKGWYNADGTEFLDAYGGSLKGLWEPGDGITVTSLTGYEWYDRKIQDEGDASPLALFPATWNDKSYQVSQEVRAEGEMDRFHWTAGLFFLHEQLNSFNLFPNTRNKRIQQTFDQQLWSGAPYLGGTYDLTESLSFKGGFRYVVESKSFTLGTETFNLESGVQDTEIPTQSDARIWNAPTGDATLTWAPESDFLEAVGNDAMSLYAKYSHAMKGGHFNASLTILGGNSPSVALVEAVKPEFIDAVEIGAKTSWFDERLTLNAAAFRYWYKDLQVFSIENSAGELPLQKLFNSNARVWGAEMDFRANPLPGLFLQGSFGWLDTELKDFTVTKCVSRGSRGECFAAEFDYGGNPLIAAPEFSFAGIVEYDIPLWSWGFLRPQYDFSWRTKLWLDPQKLDPISQPAYWLHNLRLAYRTPDERIEVAGWVENLTNEQYKIDVFDISREFDTILEVWGEPRMYGITLSYAW